MHPILIIIQTQPFIYNFQHSDSLNRGFIYYELNLLSWFELFSKDQRIYAKLLSE